MTKSRLQQICPEIGDNQLALIERELLGALPDFRTVRVSETPNSISFNVAFNSAIQEATQTIKQFIGNKKEEE